MASDRWGPWRWMVASRVLLAAATLVATRARGEEPRFEPHLLGNVAAEIGPFTRAMSRELHASDPGAAMIATIDQADVGISVGGRAEVKYLFVAGAYHALGPRLAYSLGAPATPHEWTLATEIASYSVRDRYQLHTVTAGFEFQTLRRQLVIAVDLGLVHAVDRTTFASAELDGESSGTVTLPLIRQGVGSRWPLGNRIASTVTGSVELGPGLARALLSLGLELDAGRAYLNRPPPERPFRRRVN